MEDAEQSRNQSSPLIEGGSEFAGAVVGGAIGLLGGPIGVVAGAAGGVAVTRVMKHVGEELQERLLAPRQTERVATAAMFAANEIRSRLESGGKPRSDWFSEDTEGGSSDAAEELLEGVLLVAANAYEERKVPYLGTLYASLAFDSTIDRGYANMLLRTADSLTYRDLVCLALFAPDERRASLRFLDISRERDGAASSEPIVAELTELGQSGLLGVKQEDGRVSPPYAVFGGGNLSTLPLAQLETTYLGTDLYRLMGLASIPREDLVEVFLEMGGDAAQLTK